LFKTVRLFDIGPFLTKLQQNRSKKNIGFSQKKTKILFFRPKKSVFWAKQ